MQEKRKDMTQLLCGEAKRKLHPHRLVKQSCNVREFGHQWNWKKSRPWDNQVQLTHFTVKETEAWKGEIACSKSHKKFDSKTTSPNVQSCSVPSPLSLSLSLTLQTTTVALALLYLPWFLGGLITTTFF